MNELAVFLGLAGVVYFTVRWAISDERKNRKRNKD